MHHDGIVCLGVESDQRRRGQRVRADDLRLGLPNQLHESQAGWIRAGEDVITGIQVAGSDAGRNVDACAPRAGPVVDVQEPVAADDHDLPQHRVEA